MKIILILGLYNWIFFYKFYRNPFRMATSELISLYFPFWRWSCGRIIFKDAIYFPYPVCMPVLSSFYPVSFATSYCQKWAQIDKSFVLFANIILLHFLLGSILAFYSLTHLGFGQLAALFGAISLTYSAYFVKPFTPCAAYSMAWMPGILLGGWKGSLCLCMAILGGYWPIAIFSSVLLFFAPSSWWGVLLGLPQIIPVLWYWPKSIRAGAKFDQNFGKVPLWRYVDLILPNLTQNTINGVFWPEMALYLGIIPLMIGWSGLNLWIVVLALSLVIKIQRVPARSLYLFSCSLVMLSLKAKITFPILLIQAYLLLQNADIYPHFPFCQWWKRPSEFFAGNPIINRWPYYTGYIQNKHIGFYNGSVCLKEHVGDNSYVGFC